MSGHLKIKEADAVLEIVLNRPECGNLITMSMISEIGNALRNLSAKTTAVVLRGEGKDFCKGRDYAQAPEDAKRHHTPDAVQIRDNMTMPILAMYSLIRDLPVPTISVVQGTATGFGCAMACACDVVLAGRGARFSLPEMRERRLPPTLAMTALYDRIGYRTLAYLVFSTEELDGDAAVKSGLASAAFEDTDLDRRSRQIISTVASLPPATVKSVKAYLKAAPSMDTRGRAELGSSLYAVVASSARDS
jgi:enoyl-CoA hydratase/carnithine racemase